MLVLFLCEDIAMENTNNETITFPIVENGVTFDGDKKIINCTIDDNNNISGTYQDTTLNKNIKAKYIYKDNKWFYGRDICHTNLVSLKDRTLEERREIVSKAHTKARENRENKKNFNELAKAMLEQTVTEEQIKAVLGDNTNILMDNSVASVILASMINGAVNGSFKCAEFVRDTAGYKPKNEVEIQADVMTDSDRALIDKLSKRIG